MRSLSQAAIFDHTQHFGGKGRRYITDMHRDYMGIVADAITASGGRDIHIDQHTMPGTPYQATYFSIYVEPDCDCSDFWRVYEALLAEPTWRMWLKLVRC
jgi:hypothetical protein